MFYLEQQVRKLTAVGFLKCGIEFLPPGIEYRQGTARLNQPSFGVAFMFAASSPY